MTDTEPENCCNHFALEGIQQQKHRLVREHGEALAHLIDAFYHDGLEKSAALMKLRECVFWSSAAMAREPAREVSP